jgi:hypothetical protein
MSGLIVDMSGEPIKDAAEFPASKAVHWTSGVVYACDEHAREIVKLGEFMGSHIPVSYAPPGSQCKNCENESIKSYKSQHELKPSLLLPRQPRP